MLERLFRFYQRKRVVNINVNIITAGLLAIGCSKLLVMAVEHASSLDPKSIWFTLIGAGADIAFDAMVYYILHWVANHWRPLRLHKPVEGVPQTKPRPFFRDATLVQFERAMLSPIYYGIGMGLMYVLQQHGVTPSLALAIGFPTGLVMTRVIHTIWGLKTGRFRDTPRPSRRSGLRERPDPPHAAEADNTAEPDSKADRRPVSHTHHG